jgi:hypothetical protein
LGRAAAYEGRNLPQFASIRDPISNLNNFPRLAVSPSAYRALRSKAMVVLRRVNQGETRVDLDETLPFMACRKEGGARLRAGHERRRFLKPLLAVG